MLHYVDFIVKFLSIISFFNTHFGAALTFLSIESVVPWEPEAGNMADKLG